MTLLSVERVGKSFAGLRALHDVSFEVHTGEVVGLMGANGAGKTTLFALIAGHQRPSEGEIRFRGRSLVGLRPDRICRLGVARTYQIVRPFPGLSARENVEVALLYGAESDGRRLAEEARHILDRVGLGHAVDKPAASLTLSDRKRLEVARALGTAPELLLLDEVMAGLTPTEVVEMLETIRRLKDDYGLTLVVVEHVVRALVELAERLVVLHHGELIAEGTPAAIAEDAAVRLAYFGESAE